MSCALSAFSYAFLIPILSIMSLVSLIPAVSIKRKATPAMINSSSMASRVVPAISETMAFSSFSKVFNRVDFPTLGSPIIATGIPFFMAFPKEKESIKRLSTKVICATNSLNFVLSANSTSSPEKSNSNSIKAAKSNNCARNSFNSFAIPPRICWMAI